MGFDNVNVNVCGGQSIIKALQNYNTVILKPNIVDNRNVLTQEMMSERHTKYVIRWNYSLEGATINVPEDCIIEFAGGTIDNGTIVGNNTILIYSKPIDEVCLAEKQGTFIYNTTVADEEDITSASGQLKFKDRPNTDGMGRRILRKNIVNGVNTLTQSMMTQTNTIYVIQYDFTLGEDITVPANCVLEFDGGSISASGDNDTITGNNTGISAGLVKILNTNVTLAGRWNVAEAYPEWFGIIANDNNADLSLAMPQLNSFNARVHFGKGIYNTLNPVKLIDVEGVSPKDTIISMKKSGTGLYTAYVGDITVPSSSLVRENWFLRNLAIAIDAPTAQDNITSSCALLIGNSGYSNIENCIITTYYDNIKATETFTEQQRIEAAKNDDKALENSANSGVRFKGYVDGLVVKDTTFVGQIGIYQEENSNLDSNTFINCYTIGSLRGYAGIIFNGSVSSITFQQLSISQAMFGIKAYKNFNGITINGGRSEQSIVLKDPDDNKVLGGFLYVNKTDNDIIAATILSYYMDNSVNGIYLKNGSGLINVGIYNLYNRGNYGTDLKYALYASSSNMSSIINTRNATFQNAPVTLDGMIISECDYTDIDTYDYTLISNCIIRSEQYEYATEYKNYQYDGNRIFAPFITRGGGALTIRLTKRLKDNSDFTCCRLKGIANMYNAASTSGYTKSIDFDILVDKNGNIIKEEKVNDTGNDMSVSVDTSTCIVTLTVTRLTDIIGECVFYKSTYD